MTLLLEFFYNMVSIFLIVLLPPKLIIKQPNDSIINLASSMLSKYMGSILALDSIQLNICLYNAMEQLEYVIR